jgi:hypothetical protein
MNRAKFYLALAKAYRWLEGKQHGRADQRAAQARKLRGAAAESNAAALDLFDDYKIAVRSEQESKVLDAAYEQEEATRHAESLRMQAESLEVQAAARYTAVCNTVQERMDALHKESI